MRFDMRQPQRKIPDPPKRPRVRTLTESSKIFSEGTVYWLSGECDKTLDTGEIDYVSEGQYAVLVKPYNSLTYLNYVTKYGYAIDVDINKFFHVVGTQVEMVKKMADMNERAAEIGNLTEEQANKFWEDMRMPTIEIRESDNAVLTPLGYTNGPVQRHVCLLIAEILSAHGRVVGVKSTGAYELAMVSIEEVLEHMPPPEAFFTEDEIDGSQWFYAILEDAQVWSVDVVTDMLSKDGEVKDDDLKNSKSGSVVD